MDELATAAVTNLPEYTVSEISGAVKRTLEGAFGRVRVRGEITEMKRYPSGHIYLCLKDEGAKMRAVVWRSAVSRLGMVPENGVEVIVTGRISSYPERSEYQLIIERMEYAGAGALLARIEMLRVRLAAEGLFDADRKRALPMLPRVIGVVTSERGAVIQDIRTTILRRFPREILLWSVPVQGEGAAARIAAAIRGFDALAEGGAVPRPDVLIVARGGGSLEDLMAFNEEEVIRAVAACRIPLISAVGHETDTTLIDFVSDRRAPTPTAAAELAIPARADLVADMQHKAARLLGGLNRLMQEQRLRLGRAERGLPDLPALVGTARQRVDDRAERLRLAVPNLLAARRAALVRAERGLPVLPALVGTARQRVDDRAERLRLALPNLLAARRAALGQAERGLPDLPALLGTARQRVNDRAERLRLAFPNLLAARRAALGRAERAMPDLPGQLAACAERVRDRSLRLRLALPNLVSARRAELERQGRMPPPHQAIAARRAALAVTGAHLAGGLRHAVAGSRVRAGRTLARLTSASLRAGVREGRAHLAGLAARLESVSPEAVLKRGYALVFDAAGHPVTIAAAVSPGARLRLQFGDGDVRATADGGKPASRQGSLPL